MPQYYSAELQRDRDPVPAPVFSLLFSTLAGNSGVTSYVSFSADGPSFVVSDVGGSSSQLAHAMVHMSLCLVTLGVGLFVVLSATSLSTVARVSKTAQSTVASGILFHSRDGARGHSFGSSVEYGTLVSRGVGNLFVFSTTLGSDG